MTEVVQAPKQPDERELKRISHWIGGRVLPGESGRSGPVYNPALGVQTGEVDFASVEEIDAAVAAAKEAFPAWRAVSLSRWQELMFRIRQFVDERLDETHSARARARGRDLSFAVGRRGPELQAFLDRLDPCETTARCQVCAGWSFSGSPSAARRAWERHAQGKRHRARMVRPKRP